MSDQHCNQPCPAHPAILCSRPPHEDARHADSVQILGLEWSSMDGLVAVRSFVNFKWNVGIEAQP